MARIEAPGDLIALRGQATQLYLQAQAANAGTPTTHEQFRSDVDDYVAWLLTPVEAGSSLTVAKAVVPFPGGAA